MGYNKKMNENSEKLIKYIFIVPKDHMPRKWHSTFRPSKSTIYRRKKKSENSVIQFNEKGIL